MPRRRALLSLMLIAACAGCGQVGPLHLPQDAPDNESYLLVKKKSVQKNAAAAAAPSVRPAPDAAPASPQ